MKILKGEPTNEPAPPAQASMQNLTILMPSGIVAILRAPVPFTPEDLDALSAQLELWRTIVRERRR